MGIFPRKDPHIPPQKRLPTHLTGAFAFFDKHSPHQTGAKPHHFTPSHLPLQPKTSPQDPATTKSEPNFRSSHGGVLWGSSGRMREVWREKGHPPKGGLFSLQGLSHPTSNIPSSPRPLALRRRERRSRDGELRRRCRCSARRGSRVKAHRPPSSSPQSASGQDAPASSP